MKVHIDGESRDKVVCAEMVLTIASHPHGHPMAAHARGILEHYSYTRHQYAKAIKKAIKKREEIYK